MPNAAPRPGRPIVIPAVSSEAVESIFTKLAVDNPLGARGRYKVADIAPLRLVHAQARGGEMGVRRRECDIDDMDEAPYFLCITLGGSVSVAQFGPTMHIGQQEMTLIDSAVRYELRLANGHDTLWLRIPRPLLDRRLFMPVDLLGMKMDARDGMARVLTATLKGILATPDSLSPREGELLASSILDLLCASLDGMRLRDALPSRSCHRTLRRACMYIEDSLGDWDLNPAGIAAFLGISTGYLGELFAGEGTTVMRWTQQRRLDRCRQQLLDYRGGYASIAEIAFGNGFRNVSSFNRAFKSAFGTNPGALLRDRLVTH